MNNLGCFDVFYGVNEVVRFCGDGFFFIGKVLKWLRFCSSFRCVVWSGLCMVFCCFMLSGWLLLLFIGLW